jgi:hypothetical protein
MRPNQIIVLLLFPLLVACKLLPAGTDGPPDLPVGQTAITEQDATINPSGQSSLRPKARPQSAINAAAPEQPNPELPSLVETAPATPEKVKSKEQIKCEKQGGSWDKPGKSDARTCIKPTRDGGKQCTKEGDCDGMCLARSRTCAPVKPLFGCNEILQKDGSRVTLCIN